VEDSAPTKRKDEGNEMEETRRPWGEKQEIEKVKPVARNHLSWKWHLIFAENRVIGDRRKKFGNTQKKGGARRLLMDG